MGLNPVKTCKQTFKILMGVCVCRSTCLAATKVKLHTLLIFLKKYFIYLFLERGSKGERGGENRQYVVASRAPPTGDMTTTQACSLGVEPATLRFAGWLSTQRATPARVAPLLITLPPYQSGAPCLSVSEPGCRTKNGCCHSTWWAERQAVFIILINTPSDQSSYNLLNFCAVGQGPSYLV